MFQPIELIRKTRDNRLEANPEALEMIRTIQKPIVTVSVVGNEEQFKNVIQNEFMCLFQVIQEQERVFWPII